MYDESGKAGLRRELLDMRSRLTRGDVEKAGTALARRALELPELADAGTVAAYVSVGSEPGTRALLDALRAQGRTGTASRTPRGQRPGLGPVRGRGAARARPARAPGAAGRAARRTGRGGGRRGAAARARGGRTRGAARAWRRIVRPGARPAGGGGRAPSPGGAPVRRRGGRAGPEGTARPPRERRGDTGRCQALHGLRPPARGRWPAFYGLSTSLSVVLFSTASLPNGQSSSSPLAHLSVWSV